MFILLMEPIKRHPSSEKTKDKLAPYIGSKYKGVMCSKSIMEIRHPELAEPTKPVGDYLDEYRSNINNGPIVDDMIFKLKVENAW